MFVIKKFYSSPRCFQNILAGGYHHLLKKCRVFLPHIIKSTYLY